MRSAFAAAVMLAALAPIPRAHAQNSSDARELEAFVLRLQRATAADDRTAVAAMIRYPITIAIAPGVRVPFADAASVLARYDDIFTPPLREAIARAAVSTVIGDGEVMIEVINGELRIISITVPQPTQDVGPEVAAPVERPTSGVVRRAGPRRVAIRVGPRPTQIPGTLLRDATDTFILFLPKGLLASIRLERVPAGAATIRVVHARTGAPLGVRVSADGRFVSGRPAEDGDYRVEVRRTPRQGSGQGSGADEAHLPYMLSLSLR